jgi:hypothetical protein
MHIPTNGLLTSFDNIKSTSIFSSSKSHSNVQSYDIDNFKLTMSPFFIISPKNGIAVKKVTKPVTKIYKKPFEDFCPEKAYELELQILNDYTITMDVLDTPAEMDTVGTVMLFLKSKNYDNEFYVNGGGSIILKNEIYHQNEIKLVKTFRFEGNSNPSDEAIIYLIKADSGPFGYSLDGYGISSNHDHDQYVEFIRHLSFQKLV